MGSIGNRLGRLEGVSPCPECGGALASEYEVTWQDGPDEKLVPELCPRCGEPLEIVVTWNDPPVPEHQA
jgi:hypothetical protein